MSGKALVIVPTYDEKENIETLIAQVLEKDECLEMLIVDDNSPDGTGELVERISAENTRVNVMHREGKLGLGSAYRAGFRWALERDYELVFEMDADFSHDPRYLPDFLAAEGDADLVIGSRYVKGVNVSFLLVLLAHSRLDLGTMSRSWTALARTASNPVVRTASATT